jgi:hypothetical protein
MTTKLRAPSFYQFIISFRYAGNPCDVIIPGEFDGIHHQTALLKNLSVGSCIGRFKAFSD